MRGWNETFTKLVAYVAKVAEGACLMITISAFKKVPEFAQGQVRDLRVRWALEEAGLPYKTITGLKGVVQLDLLDKDNALVIVEQSGGAQNLETVPLP